MAKNYFFPFMLLLCACTSLQETELLLQEARSHLEIAPTLKWEKDLAGKPSDFALAKKGDRVALALVPDRLYPRSIDKPLIAIYDSVGNLKSSRKLSARVRHLRISENGELVVFNSFEQELFFINTKGKTIAQYAEHCDPLLVDSMKEALCFFDDDNESSRIFVTYNWKGEVIGGLQLKDETALKVALLGKKENPYAGVGFVGGKFQAFERTGKLKWKTELPGEILDFKSVGQPDGGSKIVVLRHKHLLKEGVLPNQRVLSVIRADGAVVSNRSVQGGFQLLLADGVSNRFYMYGNGIDGQRLEQWQVEGDELEKNWSHHVPSQSEFLIPPVLTPEGNIFAAFTGLYRRTDSGYHTSILGFSAAGTKNLELDVPVREMGLRFGFQEPDLLWVWTEEGKLSVYSLPSTLAR